MGRWTKHYVVEEGHNEWQSYKGKEQSAKECKHALKGGDVAQIVGLNMLNTNYPCNTI